MLEWKGIPSTIINEGNLKASHSIATLLHFTDSALQKKKVSGVYLFCSVDETDCSVLTFENISPGTSYKSSLLYLSWSQLSEHCKSFYQTTKCYRECQKLSKSFLSLKQALPINCHLSLYSKRQATPHCNSLIKLFCFNNFLVHAGIVLALSNT